MQGRRNKLCAKLSSAFLRKWWFVIAFSVILVLSATLVLFGFTPLLTKIVDKQSVLRHEGSSFAWWVKPPLAPILRVYVYNVTNADEFLNNGSKPFLDELGPYTYVETWEKVDVVENPNGTVSFNQRKTYVFSEELSNGSEDDVVIVPNIPMLSATSQSKHAARFLRLAMASIMDILKIKPFVEVSVGQLLWGYEDPLLKLAKDVVTKEQKLPYEEFGLMYGKNGTSRDRVTVFSGRDDPLLINTINKFNGHSKLPFYLEDRCNVIDGSDGSIFRPRITKNTTLNIYDRDLCRQLPLTYQEDITLDNGIAGYRFTPAESVFASVENNPDNLCYCVGGPPCAPHGFFNVSLCQYDSPVLLSFPHFYMADQKYRLAVDGISPPEKEKHQFFIDAQPEMGTSLRARARLQINLAVSQVIDIKQVANFPDIVFPILWFDEGVDRLPQVILDIVLWVTQVPPKIRIILIIGLYTVGLICLIIAITCLVRSSQRQSTLHLEASNYLATTAVDQAKKKTKNDNVSK